MFFANIPSLLQVSLGFYSLVHSQGCHGLTFFETPVLIQPVFNTYTCQHSKSRKVHNFDLTTGLIYFLVSIYYFLTGSIDTLWLKCPQEICSLVKMSNEITCMLLLYNSYSIHNLQTKVHLEVIAQFYN